MTEEERQHQLDILSGQPEPSVITCTFRKDPPTGHTLDNFYLEEIDDFASVDTIVELVAGDIRELPEGTYSVYIIRKE